MQILNEKNRFSKKYTKKTNEKEKTGEDKVVGERRKRPVFDFQNNNNNNNNNNTKQDEEYTKNIRRIYEEKKRKKNKLVTCLKECNSKC